MTERLDGGLPVILVGARDHGCSHGFAHFLFCSMHRFLYYSSMLKCRQLPTLMRMPTHPATSKILALMVTPGRLRLLGMNKMMTTDAESRSASMALPISYTNACTAVEAMVISPVTALSPVRVWPVSTAARKGKR